MNPENRKIVAAFDFDGTLTYGDTLLPFLLFTEGSFKGVFKLLRMLPSSIQFLLGSISRDELKEEILTRFFKGKKVAHLRLAGDRFVQGPLQKLFRKNMLEKLKEHQAKGHTVVIVSANLDLFLAPFCQEQQIPYMLSTSLEMDREGVATGKMLGRNCRGVEKARRLSALLGSKEGYILYAYGDSRGDREMLAMADYPFKL